MSCMFERGDIINDVKTGNEYVILKPQNISSMNLRMFHVTATYLHMKLPQLFG